MSGATGLGPWADDLQDASWRGVRFAVKVSTIRRGRRVAVHEYPYRDVVWVEDLGRGTRAYSFSGFLIGDDVFAQRDEMADAAETAGAGELVHPSIGSIQAVVTEFSAGERWDLGRVIELEFSFIEPGQDQPVYPTADADTQGQVETYADATDVACGDDFLSDAADAVVFGSDVLAAGTQIVLGWIGLIDRVVADAGMIASAVTGLAGANYGRYANGARTSLQPPGTTTASALLALSVARATIMTASAVAVAAAPAAMPAALQGLAEATRGIAGDPAAQVRLLVGLATFAPTILPGDAPIGQAMATMGHATAALCRRAALASLARAGAAYGPTSYDDAIAQLQAIVGPLDAEILTAADAGDLTSYLALRSLRTATITDLVARGSRLPRLITISRSIALPSLTLAYQLYRDATRSDDLIARADPIHPLFMPREMRVLSA